MGNGQKCCYLLPITLLLITYSSPKSVVRLRGFVRKDSIRILSHNPFRIAILPNALQNHLSRTFTTIHHISLAVNNPLHVAQVVAELWQGRAVPFPIILAATLQLTLTPTAQPLSFSKDTVLKPEPNSVGFYKSGSATGYTATHANLAVPISETEVYKIADREGWRAIRCRWGELLT